MRNRLPAWGPCSGPEPQNIERALELAKDLLAVIREKHAEALQQGPPQGQFHGGGFQPSGANGYPGGGPPRYGAPGMGGMGGPGMDPHQQQNPYQYQVRFIPVPPLDCHPLSGSDLNLPPSQANQYASPGLTAPLPPGEAPPAPPPGADGSAGGASAAPAGGAAASGMSNEQYMAWWNSLDAASQAYYTQCVPNWSHVSSSRPPTHLGRGNMTLIRARWATGTMPLMRSTRRTRKPHSSNSNKYSSRRRRRPRLRHRLLPAKRRLLPRRVTRRRRRPLRLPHRTSRRSKVAAQVGTALCHLRRGCKQPGEAVCGSPQSESRRVQRGRNLNFLSWKRLDPGPLHSLHELYFYMRAFSDTSLSSVWSSGGRREEVSSTSRRVARRSSGSVLYPIACPPALEEAPGWENGSDKEG